MQQTWSRARCSMPRKPVRSIFPDDRPPQRIHFRAAYELDCSEPNMPKLLSWDYGRMWLHESKEFHKKTRVSNRTKFIDPGIEHWLIRRRVMPDPRQLFVQRMEDKKAAKKEKRESERRINAGASNGGFCARNGLCDCHAVDTTHRRLHPTNSLLCYDRKRNGVARNNGSGDRRRHVVPGAGQGGVYVARGVCDSRRLNDGRGDTKYR